MPNPPCPTAAVGYQETCMISSHATGASSTSQVAGTIHGKPSLKRLACLISRHNFVEPGEQTAALQAAMNDIDACHAHFELTP